jgi:hypothetical protein
MAEMVADATFCAKGFSLSSQASWARDGPPVTDGRQRSANKSETLLKITRIYPCSF